MSGIIRDKTIDDKLIYIPTIMIEKLPIINIIVEKWNHFLANE